MSNTIEYIGFITKTCRHCRKEMIYNGLFNNVKVEALGRFLHECIEPNCGYTEASSVILPHHEFLNH